MKKTQFLIQFCMQKPDIQKNHRFMCLAVGVHCLPIQKAQKTRHILNAMHFSNTNIVKKQVRHEIFHVNGAGSGREAVA